MRLRLLIICALLALPGAGFVAHSFHELAAANTGYSREVGLARAHAEDIKGRLVEYRERPLRRGESFAGFLQEEGLDRPSVNAIVGEAAKVADLRRMRAGHDVWMGIAADRLRLLRYRMDGDNELWITGTQEGYRAELKKIPYVEEVVTVAGEVEDALFNAVLDAGERPELAVALADIFAWDLDFYTDPQPGDVFRLVVEKKTYGELVRYGRILAAEYRNAGHPFQAVLFREPSGAAAYYAPDGKSLKKAFLKSPLKFAAPVTSHFSRSRVHPVLRIRRPHLGTDYGAPIGTPVQAIGSGKVVFAGRKGGGGNMVQIRHSNGFETYYLHLSRILVHNGQNVEQGKVIGRVGMTGLASGPHLDFRIRQGGQFRNFESLRLPPALPVAKSDWADFIAVKERWLPMLDQAVLAKKSPEAQPGS